MYINVGKGYSRYGDDDGDRRDDDDHDNNGVSGSRISRTL